MTIIHHHDHGKTCLIWRDFAAKHVTPRPVREGITWVEGSTRAGGDYTITRQAEQLLSRTANPFDDKVRARLTTRLIEMRAQGEPWPQVTTDLIRQVEGGPDLTPAERSDRLLILMGAKSDTLDHIVSLAQPEIQAKALAHSESVSETELPPLLAFLVVNGWAKASHGINAQPGWSAVVTVSGHKRIETLTKPSRPSPIGFNPGVSETRTTWAERKETP